VTSVLLLRHGQSTWNAERRWQGRADPPLSELGRRQAAAARISDVDVVVSSPLVRAHETARIVAASIGRTVAEVHADLQEREAGEWTGLTRVEIAARTPGAPESGARPVGYETDTDVWERARRALCDLAGRHEGRTVLAISHGGLIGVVAQAVDPAVAAELGPVPHLGGIAVDVDLDGQDAGRFGPAAVIRLLGSAAATTPASE
jgi:probable phosphoglycerate mutase